MNYDARGNMTSDGTKTFGYDPENHMMAVKNVGGSTIATYQYDPLGRRTAKTVGSTVTAFVHDGDDEVAEYDASGNVALVIDPTLFATNPMRRAARRHARKERCHDDRQSRGQRQAGARRRARVMAAQSQGLCAAGADRGAPYPVRYGCSALYLYIVLNHVGRTYSTVMGAAGCKKKEP